MKARDLKATLAAFKATGQTVAVEVRSDGTVVFTPMVPTAPVNPSDPVMEALSRAR